MKYPGVNEKDWKLFRSRIAEWQESYMEKIEKGYIELLTIVDVLMVVGAFY